MSTALFVVVVVCTLINTILWLYCAVKQMRIEELVKALPSRMNDLPDLVRIRRAPDYSPTNEERARAAKSERNVVRDELMLEGSESNLRRYRY